MFELVKRFMQLRLMKFEEGGIRLLDQPIFMIPAKSLIDIQKGLEAEERENFIYEMGKKSGYDWSKKTYGDYKFKSVEELVKTNADCITMAGFGVASIEEIRFEDNFVRKRLENSIIAREYGKSEFPVDHYLRGLMAGAASFYLKGNFEGIETKCLACGDPYCEFIMRLREDFDFENPLVKKQLGKKDI